MELFEGGGVRWVWTDRVFVVKFNVLFVDLDQ